jgi:Flp pilus assembly protein TadD
LRESIRLNSTDAYAHSALGAALYVMARHDEAEASLHEALRLNPADAYAQKTLRMTLDARKR